MHINEINIYFQRFYLSLDHTCLHMTASDFTCKMVIFVVY